MKIDERNFRRRLHEAVSRAGGIQGMAVENTAGSGSPDLHYWSKAGYALFELKVCKQLSVTAQSVKFTPAQDKWWTLAERKNLRAWVIVQIGEGDYLYTILPKSALDNVGDGGLRYAAVPFSDLTEYCCLAARGMSYDPSCGGRGR